MKVLITGGAGFIGSHIAEALLARGDEVAIVDNLSTGRRSNVPDGAVFLRADIAGLRSGLTTIIRPDVIYHAAASYRDPADWEGDARTNVQGTIAVVREALAVGARLVYFQTSLCYGLNPASPVSVNDRLDPRGSYAVSKTAAECYIRDSGVDYVSLRLANMYGPRNLSGPAPAFYKRLAAGLPCTVVDSRRDFMFVDDLVDVAVKAATIGSGPYHVASGGDAPIADVYRAVAVAMGLDVPEPDLVPRGADDAATILLDPYMTALEYDWRPRTSLTAGIARAVAWYREHGVGETFTHLKLED